MDIDILGIDLAKRVFQLHGADSYGYSQRKVWSTRNGTVLSFVFRAKPDLAQAI